jgi:hypothetical protein
MKSIFKFGVLAVAVALFTGCGGGGSGGGSSNNAKLAAANYDNAQKVQEAIFSNAVSSYTYKARVSSNAKDTLKPYVLDLAKSFIKLNAEDSTLKKRVISDACMSGGLDVDVISESSSSKTYLYKYNNCNDGVKVVNGEVELKLSAKHGSRYYVQSIIFKKNYRVNYSNGSKLSIANGGRIDITVTSYKSSSNYTFVLDTTMKITQNGYSYGYEGMQWNYIVSGASTYWFQTTGAIYINNYKDYVLYDNSYDMLNTPFKVDSNGYPQRGEARYKMDGAVLRIIAENGAIVLDL